MQLMVRVPPGTPAVQIPGPLGGAVASASGSTVTQAPAVRPPTPAVTGMSVTRSSGVLVGVPAIACCKSEASSKRPKKVRLTCRPLAAPAAADTPRVRLNHGWAALTHGVWESRTSGGPPPLAGSVPPAAAAPTVLTRAATASASVQRAVLARRVDTGRG